MAIGVAIVGSGIFARTAHLPAVKSCPDLKLRAIYSRSLASAKSLYEAAGIANVALYSEDSSDGKGFDDLLKRQDIQGMIIALPIPNQVPFIRRALLAGKHVLSEKPCAPTISDAQALKEFYRSPDSGIPQSTTWSVAENFRYVDPFDVGVAEIRKLGRVLGFRVNVHSCVNPEENQYFKTAWRAKPSFQGGFLLDGGVHFVAGLRLLLGPENMLAVVSAQTTLLRDYLPPVDTVDAVLKTRSGLTGTLSISFGTTFTSREWLVACEQGVVKVDLDNVEVNGKLVRKFDFDYGVNAEVRDWARTMAEARRENDRQTVEEAMADEEIIEKLLISGQNNGAPLTLQLQDTGLNQRFPNRVKI